MPVRLLRDWTDSEAISSLTVHAERFFTRLIMKADDYGVFYGNTSLLKAALYPLMLDGVREADISRWIAECMKAGLIVFYEADSKKYIQIQKFRQRLDKARSKFPLPSTERSPGSSGESFTVVNERLPDSDTDTEVDTDTEKTKPQAAEVKKKEEIIEFPWQDEVFAYEWQKWKNYKLKEYRFAFKSLHSEQAALTELFNLSGKNMLTGLAIIQQSMAKGWKGFFPLKTEKNGSTGNRSTPAGAVSGSGGY